MADPESRNVRNLSGKVVEGSRKWKDVETLWTFTLEDGRWVVSQIEEGSLSLAYADLAKTLPPVESTLLGGAPARG